MTYEIIRCEEMRQVWGTMSPEPKPEHVAKLALGPSAVEKLCLPLAFSTWQAILAEMISGDFGADCVDYLLATRTTPGWHTGALTTIA
jgi:uncharacterized protein